MYRIILLTSLLNVSTLLSLHPIEKIFKQKQPLQKIDFEEGLIILLKNNAQILEGEAGIMSFKAIKTQADQSIIPTINVLTFIGPSISVTGNPLNVQRDYSKWGPLMAGQLEFVWPIFNFGRFRKARQAAQEGLKAIEDKHQADINKLIFKYKKLYLQHILLKEYKTLLDGALKEIQSILTKAKALYKSGNGKVLKRDVVKLKLYKLELDKLAVEHESSQLTAQRALAHYLGSNAMIDIIDTKFPDINDEILSLDKLITLAFEKNLSYSALTKGIIARTKQLELAKTKILPVFFLGLRLSGSYTNVRNDQDSAFAYDPYNRKNIEGALGMQWKFNWGDYMSSRQSTESELQKLQAKKQEAYSGLPLKVSMAFWDAIKSGKHLSITYQKFKQVRQWSLSELNAYTNGIGETKNLIEALGAYHAIKKDITTEKFNHIVAWSKVSLEVGRYSLLKKL